MLRYGISEFSNKVDVSQSKPFFPGATDEGEHPSSKDKNCVSRDCQIVSKGKGKFGKQTPVHIIIRAPFSVGVFPPN